LDIRTIRGLNKNFDIKKITDLDFRQYGKLLDDYDFGDIIKFAKENIKIPTTGNEYVPSVADLESFNVVEQIKNNVYGQMPIEVGFCAGHNQSLTGVEYHQGSEVVIAVTDCVHVLGKVQEIKDNTYNPKTAQVFVQPKGTAIEIYGTTLHYSPCKFNDEGFMTLVILPYKTNFPLEGKYNKVNTLLTKKNKFLMVHPSKTEKIANGVHPGLTGELINIKIK
jgi:hypothetical protein